MLAWLRGLIGAAPAATQQRAPPPPLAGAAAVPPAVAPAATFVARSPLVGRDGAVAGFAVGLSAALQQRVDGGLGTPASAAWQTALLAAAAPLAASGTVALVRVPAALLLRQAVAAAVPAGAWLHVDALDTVPADLAGRLRASGARLGVSDGPPAAQPAPDFVVLQADVADNGSAQLSAERWRERWPRIQVVVCGLAGVGALEKALRDGAHLASAALADGGAPALPSGAPPRALGSAAHRICELLNHLALDRDLATLAEAVRADVALAYRLLRYANSAAIGATEPVQTVDRAVQLLGRGEITRWLSVQLLSAAESRQASRALQHCALARGRLLETLARNCGASAGDAGALFTLGLLSLIEPLLQVPLVDALAPLRLGPATRDALLQRQGPWAGWLLLAEALEAGDADGAVTIAEAHGLPLPDAAEAAAAWDWARVLASAGDD